MSTAIPILDLQDPRLDHYRDLPDRALAREQDRFVCEGRWLVERLLDSDFEVDSVLMAEGGATLANVPPSVPVYTAPLEVIQRLVGYKFHRGALAMARRKPLLPLDVLVGSMPNRGTVVVLADVGDSENVGAIIRTAAGLGVGGVVIAGSTHDPFYRRALRASMGTTFRVSLAVAEHVMVAVEQLNQSGFQTIACVAPTMGSGDDSAFDLGGHSVLDLPAVPDHPKRAIFLGAEGPGLDHGIAAVCSIRATIPMVSTVDSLNVAAAAAIMMHELR